MKIGLQKVVEVEAKTLRIHMKVRDEFSAQLLDQDGQVIVEKEDINVPDFMPEDHWGDYLILNINLDSGQVTNWVKPTQRQIEEFVKGDE